VDTIHARFFKGDQTIEFIAQDFDLKPSVVQEIIRLAPQANPTPA
jgi:hypothetical protein